MRVIAGTFRGRPLVAPRGLEVRPTPDRVREAFFDIMGDRVKGGSFLDLFAGSGAVGIEALSRGAERVVLVESSREALRSIDRNLQSLGIADRIEVVRAPWPQALAWTRAGKPFSAVFADPPYARAPYAAILESLSPPGLLDPMGWAVLEHELRAGAPERAGDLSLARVARYGRVGLAFYVRTSSVAFPEAGN